jgi:hypothetical protein
MRSILKQRLPYLHVLLLLHPASVTRAVRCGLLFNVHRQPTLTTVAVTAANAKLLAAADAGFCRGTWTRR